ncbi:MAG: peptide chain release factor N(5)-glutamine methyltransferase [Gammaproteobacteria bacterium]|nr:MAG: peptide chain release factor N(5)-glutamine methyltransferase [Gammaproteobacteria bacterium]
MSAQQAVRVTLAAALQQAVRRLAHYENPALEAELLLAHVLNLPRSKLHLHPDQALTPAQSGEFDTLVTRRAQGEPSAYLTGARGFWSLELRVTPDVLIPRPETELLVELALQKIPADAAWRIADLGAGSGAIALALAHERPHCQFIATDISPAALEVARANAARLNTRNVAFRLGDWFSALQNERFDVIVSNPPYVRGNDPHLHDLRFEPQLALVAGADGLQQLRVIAAQARGHFTQGGWLLLEHGYDQAPAMMELLAALGYRNIQDHPDLGGVARVTVACWNAYE